MSIARAASKPFGGRLQTFVREALPERITGKAVGGYFKDDPRPNRAVASEMLGYIRKLRAGAIDQSGLERAWDVGAALARLTTTERWANPVVSVFVAGYYGHVAELLISTRHERMSSRLRADMAVALLSVPWPTSTGTPGVAQLREQYMSEGADELSAQEGAAWEGDLVEWRPDRERWMIDGGRYAAFVGTWKRIKAQGLDMQHPAIATCQFITERADYDVAARDKIAVGLIAGALMTP